jgi:uncharacterized membrane protein YdjX (TVP38/TMEM64 family)
MCAGLLVFFLRTVLSEQRVLSLLEWIAQQGVLAPILFVTVQCVFVVGIAPGLLLSLAAGFLFGFLPGFAYVWIGTLLGSMIAYELAPLVLKKRSDRLMRRFPVFQKLDSGFSVDGWKIVLLRCLVPLFPFKLSNYAFGLSKVSRKQFIAGTALGIIPIGAFNVYLGSLSANLSTLGAGESRNSEWEWITFAVGGVVIIATLIFVTRRAYAILNKETKSCG